MYLYIKCLSVNDSSQRILVICFDFNMKTWKIMKQYFTISYFSTELKSHFRSKLVMSMSRCTLIVQVHKLLTSKLMTSWFALSLDSLLKFGTVVFCQIFDNDRRRSITFWKAAIFDNQLSWTTDRCHS